MEQCTSQNNRAQVASTDTSSVESLQVAMEWLRICENNHDACNRERNQAQYYPTRLLDLSSPTSPEGSVRLIETAEEHPTGVYATLSHRWGAAQFIQLTRENAATYRKEIRIEAMPKTFQDAVSVSKRLGVRYLWIDSMCIMQDKDDLSDWFHEAQLMHKVYSHSYCNLSATDGLSSSDGLFRSRNPDLLRVAEVDVCVRRHHKRIELSTYSLEHNGFWRLYVTDAPINTRGWVFQERTLAPRVLHFGRYQLFWECRENNACEKYPEKVPSTGLSPEHLKSSFDRGLCPGYEHSRYQYSWKLIVLAYSQTSLTYSEDKLIALSGIAKAYASAMADTYVAGMWRNGLERQLSWFRHADSYPLSPDPLSYRAPSWSWASVDAAVEATCMHKRDEPLVSVEDIRLTYATDDITGRVTGGWLDLRGTLRQIHLMQSKRLPLGLYIWELMIVGHTDSVSVEVDLDVPEPHPLPSREDSAARKLFYMVLGYSPFGLQVILLRSDASRNGWFQRIGVGWLIKSAEILLSAVDKDIERQLPSLCYDGSMHTIRIV
jgi:hypothetical protein